MAVPDELAATLKMRWKTAQAYAETVARDPRSTIEPPRPDSDERTRKAFAAWQALASVPSQEALAIDRTIGEGGMGVVHLAEQVALGRKVAVKTLREGNRERDAVLKLLREAWITGALEHPNVVPVYDVGFDAHGGPRIVLKRIEGVAWFDVMHAPAQIAERFGAHEPLEWNLGILAQVCRAVHFAHSRGVVHRDLKPENVMIGSFGEVYVLDWGIAVSLKDDGSGRFPLAAEAHEMAGTPVYMAPEMLGGEAHRLSERSDVYLLGATLYDIVVGHPPHQGPNAQAIIASIVLSEPAIPESVPVELARVIRRAMARDPDDRYASADELRKAIEWYLRHRGSLRLSDDATKSLARLREGIESNDGSAEQRRQLYNLLGECRFGYRAALVQCAENEDARRGLRDALLAMTEYELAHDPDAAALLLSEIDGAPGDLARRVEQARARRAEERDRAERLQRELDKTPGSRTRLFITNVLGSIWVLSPLLRFVAGERSFMRSLDFTIVLDVLLIVLSVGLGVWGRESLSKTAVNRRMMAMLIFVFVGQTLLGVAMKIGGFPPQTVHWMHVFCWFMSIGAIVIHLERGLVPALVACGAVFVASAKWPDFLYLGMSLANLVLVANVVWVWLPHARRTPPPQRRGGGTG